MASAASLGFLPQVTHAARPAARRSFLEKLLTLLCFKSDAAPRDRNE
jgi:hypothetical protein